MLCHEFCEIADSYLSDELLVETNHDMLHHLEVCSDCRRELAARREVRDKLRRAVSGSPDLQLRAEFDGQMRAQLQAADVRARKTAFSRPAWIALAACLLVVGTFGLRALLRQTPTPELASRTQPSSLPTHSRPEEEQQATYAAISGLGESAAGVHRDCAVNFRLAEIPIELDEAGRKYDRAFLNLDQAVKALSGTAAEAFEFIEAHACVFQGHRFGHVVLKYQGHLVSLLVTDRDVGAMHATARQETPGAAFALPQISACTPGSGYQVSCFETARHAIFVVSDLSETENLRLARALAPGVRAHIAGAKHVA